MHQHAQSYWCYRDNSSQSWRESFSDWKQCHQSQMDFLPSASWGFTYLLLRPEPLAWSYTLHACNIALGSSNSRWMCSLILLQLFKIPYQERLRLATRCLHIWARLTHSSQIGAVHEIRSLTSTHSLSSNSHNSIRETEIWSDPKHPHQIAVPPTIHPSWVPVGMVPKQRDKSETY